VAAIVDALVQGPSDRYQVDVEEVPATAPSLGQGAALFQANCARCHGSLGRGDGKDAVGLDPKPGNLANAQGLADASPLDFYRRVTIGVAGTAMPGFAAPLSLDERWAVALYATTLRLPAPAGSVPPALTAFATTARMSDQQVLDALGAATSWWPPTMPPLGPPSAPSVGSSTRRWPPPGPESRTRPGSSRSAPT
jgi:mono/diheme cytochrome c family protein